MGEVDYLMGLFVSAPVSKVVKLHKSGICLWAIGNPRPVAPRLQTLIASAEMRTACGDRLALAIGANHCGQRDVQQAFRGWLKARQASGYFVEERIDLGDIGETRPSCQVIAC